MQAESVNKPLVFYNGTVILPEQESPEGAVICRDGQIEAVGGRSELTLPEDADWIDAGGGYISPGFVDIHVHGGAGADFMDGHREAVERAAQVHARHGTTSIFPTTTTGSVEQIEAMLAACRQVQAKGPSASGARIAGVHFYGPYFAEEKAGCHARSGCRNPDPGEYRKALETGIIRVATCAAELPGAEAFYREAERHGCLVTCGHSNASWAEMQQGYEAGLRHVDHFWCAMSSVPSVRDRLGTPMQGSMAEFVLMHREMSTEVIADGCHLAAELLDFAVAMKGPDRLCLVTDANRAMGMPPGDYRFGPESDGEWFRSDGRVGFQPGAGLASSVVGMDTMVRNMARLTRATVCQAVRMGSLTPAERTGMDREIGSLTAGKRADILVLDRALEVMRVFVGGTEMASGAGRPIGNSQQAIGERR